MEPFAVVSVEKALQLAVVGLVAGVIFYALEKYVIVSLESAVGLGTASTTTTTK